MEEENKEINKERVSKRGGIEDEPIDSNTNHPEDDDFDNAEILAEENKVNKKLEGYYEATQEKIKNEKIKYTPESIKKVSFFRKKINYLVDSYVLTYKSLSPEKIFGFWLFSVLGFIFLILGINALSQKLQIIVPSYGGVWDEGVIGVPRYVNPVISFIDTGKDLSSLVYSGLLRKDEFGVLVNDLAVSVEESEDHLSYTVIINDKAFFHDGKKLTADDVVFTINKIKEPALNSRYYIEFEGVTVEKIDEYTVVFKLKKPFIYFKDSLTVGILPKHIWDGLSTETFTLSEYNINPIGSGPYKVTNIIKENNLPKKYELNYFDKYISGRPYIPKINIYIYKDQTELANALKNGEIDNTTYLDKSLISENLKENSTIISSTLSNIYYLSFNPNKNINLSKKEIRNSLAFSIDKEKIVNDIFSGYARKLDVVFGDTISQYTATSTDWEKDKIPTITLTTADIEDLKMIAEEIAKSWREMGIDVAIKVYSTGDLAEIIKNRDFEVLLFGSIISKDTDLYAYLHSSQRNYPGLNISGYASKNMDTNLEILRDSLDINERAEALENINTELLDETPVLPIYSNNSNYIIKNKTEAENINPYIPTSLTSRNERFTSINKWYVYKEKIWKFSYLKDLIDKLQRIIH